MKHFSFMLIDPPSEWGGNIQDMFNFIRSNGYDGIELNLSQELIANIDEVKEAADRNNLQIVSMLTGQSYLEGLCLASPELQIRQQAVTRLKNNINLASSLNSILVVGLLQGLRSDESDSIIANQRICSCLQEIGDVALDNDVDIVIEPVNHLQVGFNNTVQEVKDLIQSIGSEAFYPMVDTIHMNIEERTLHQPIYSCGSKLRHVHLCESNGGLPGTGGINFAMVLEVLKRIQYPYFSSVKVYRNTNLKEAIPKSIEFFKKALGL